MKYSYIIIIWSLKSLAVKNFAEIFSYGSNTLYLNEGDTIRYGIYYVVLHPVS
jgi:hypothetical protein